MGKRQRNRITPALPVVARQLVNTVHAAETSGDWNSVTTALAQHPELWDVLSGLKARADAREGKAATANNVPVAASLAKANPTTLDMSVINTRNQADTVNNVRILRRYSMIDPWVRAVIDLRRQQISGADIAVVPLDPQRKYDKGIMSEIGRILKNPNELWQNWGEFIGSVLEDVLVLDRGCITKDMTPKRRPLHLYASDGGNLRIYPGWDGNPKTPRYLWDPPEGGKKLPLRNDEAIVICRNPATYRFGLSPVQVLIDTIQRDLDASLSVGDSVTMKPPAQMVHLQGATDSAVRAFRSIYDTEIAGKKKIMFAGGEGDIKAIPFVLKDGEWLPWLTYLAQQICAVFQVSPQAIGFLLQANKSNSASQQEREEDAGLIPLMLLLELYLNLEFVGDFAPRDRFGMPDLEALNLGIIFPRISEDARMLHAQETMDMAKTALAGAPSMTLNEIRKMRGDEPQAGGDSYYYPTKSGMTIWLDETGFHEPESPTSTSGNEGAQGPSGPTSDDDVDAMSDDASGSGGEGDAPNLDGGLEQGGTAPEAPAAKAWLTKGALHSGCMVAFYPDSKTAAQLAIPGGEPADDLHVTLTFHGEAHDLTVPLMAKLKDTVARYVASSGPLEGCIGGIGRFMPEGADTHPIYAAIDMPGLTAFRDGLALALAHADDRLAPNDVHGFTPHMTLQYVDAKVPTPIDAIEPLRLYFHNVHVVAADTHYVYELGNGPAMQPTQPEPPNEIRRSTTSDKAYHDVRRPGKAWRPEHARMVAPVVTKATSRASGRDKVTAKPRKVLETRAREIFEDVGRKRKQAS